MLNFSGIEETGLDETSPNRYGDLTCTIQLLFKQQLIYSHFQVLYRMYLCHIPWKMFRVYTVCVYIITFL